MNVEARWIAPLVVVSVAGLAACGGGETGGGGQAEQEGGARMEAQQETSGGMAQTEEISLAPKNQSGIKGTASVRHGADTVRVTLSLSGLEAGNSYPAHVHQGTCQQGGGVAVPLTSVQAQGSKGSSETRFPASRLSMDESYFIQAHLPDGTPAACGDLPSGGGGSSSGSGMSGGSGSSGSGGGGTG